MSEKIEAALTPEKWAALLTHESNEVGDYKQGIYADIRPGGGFSLGSQCCGCEIGTEYNRAIAALALHGQRFGFSWADVDALRECSRCDTGELGSAVYRLDCIADRIAALLPPRATE